MSSEKKDRNISDHVRSLVHRVDEGLSAAVLTTVTPEGRPHAMWMGTMCSDDLSELLTVTSPDSRKVTNIRANASVEWMFSDKDFEAIVYLRGHAVVVDDVARVKDAWEQIGDMHRAFFLDYFNSGMGFVVIETEVDSIEVSFPRECRTEQVPLVEPGGGGKA
ncbi:MAG: pyridoxamine 5'-phosphate oxidase family protein [Verrucomicrobiales bacterium]